VNSALLRTLVVYGIVLPLAVIVGWMLSTPLHLESLSVIGGVIFILLLPVILSHHYAILLFSWNALITAFFLPGKPYLWTLMVAINLGMMVMYRVLQRKPLFIRVPSLTLSTVALIVIVLATAKLRGGYGVRSLGSGTYGGKNYFLVFMSLLGYFALASRAIDPASIRRFTGSFYLSGLTAAIPHLIYFVPALYVLYEVFPPTFAVSQYLAEQTGAMNRLGGVSTAAAAVAYFLLARFGVRGILVKPGKFVLFAVAIVVSLFGGFRSVLLFIVGLFTMLYLIEGLLRTKWTLVGLLMIGLSFAAIVPFASKMPRTVQRVLSVLPLEIDPRVRADAEGSTDWRKRMWASLMPEVSKYLWLGKGYALNPTDMFLVSEAVRRGYLEDFSTALYVGDYHNGPLSVLIGFGIPGSLAFLFFLAAIGRALYLNNKYGSARAQVWNRFLLTFFISKVLMFFFVFGSFHGDLAAFSGLAGLSVALNGGVCRYPAVKPRKVAETGPPLGLTPSAA
jgi:O-antigen ligase